jgi:hypothetical protein
VFKRVIYIIFLLFTIGCSEKKEATEDQKFKDFLSGKVDQISIPIDNQQVAPLPEEKPKPYVETEQKINGVYSYSGYSYHKIKLDQKLVSVDIELYGDLKNADLDDVLLSDGVSGEGLAEFPHWEQLDKDGNLLPPSKPFPKGSTPVHLLLIFAIPNNTKSLRLSYWGQPLTDKAIEIGPSGGLILKKPEKKS